MFLINEGDILTPANVFLLNYNYNIYNQIDGNVSQVNIIITLLTRQRSW